MLINQVVWNMSGVVWHNAWSGCVRRRIWRQLWSIALCSVTFCNSTFTKCSDSYLRENIFRPTIGKEGLHQDSNDNGVRLVNFATSKNLVVKSTMFPHRNIHKYTWTSPDGKTNNQMDHILIDRRRHSSILDVRSYRGADCDTDHWSLGTVRNLRVPKMRGFSWLAAEPVSFSRGALLHGVSK